MKTATEKALDQMERAFGAGSTPSPLTLQKIFDQKRLYEDSIGISPVAVYLGRDEFAQLISDPDVRRYGTFTVPESRSTLHHLEVYKLKIYRVQVDSHFGLGFDSTSQRRPDDK